MSTRDKAIELLLCCADAQMSDPMGLDSAAEFIGANENVLNAAYAAYLDVPDTVIYPLDCYLEAAQMLADGWYPLEDLRAR